MARTDKVVGILALFVGLLAALSVLYFVFGMSYEYVQDKRARAEWEASTHRIHVEDIELTELRVAFAHPGLPL